MPLARASIAALAIIVVPLAARAGPPGSLREPMQNEFDHCALMAEELGNRSLAGRLRMELLIRKSGNIYAAFIWSEQGIEDRKLEHCLTSFAPNWVFPAVAIDYQRAYTPISFVHSAEDMRVGGAGFAGQDRASVFMPGVNDLPVENTPINVKVAQDTLEIADWATNGERATAEVTVQLYTAGIEHARQALAQDPNDPQALRALSRGLAESGGDLAEARRAAERLIAIDDKSEEGHEALLRVCLASKDDACALNEFNKAAKAPDLVPRSRLLDELKGPTLLAVERLKRQSQGGAGSGVATAQVDGKGAAAPADPCAAEKGEEAQALCVVKRCLDEGSVAYAKELSSQNGTPYETKDWRAKPVAPGKLLVTRPIEPAPGASAGAGSSAEKHDALWLVNLGEQFVMRPTNIEARQITVRHNRCTARVVTGR